MSMKRPRWPISALLPFFLAASPAQATTFCASTAGDLSSALATAALSPDDDTIRVRIGTFSGLSGAAMEVRGNLTISGGWTASCASRSETGITTIAGTPAQDFALTANGSDLELLGLTFSGWNKVLLSDVAQAFGPPTDEFRVRRSRFTNTVVGLSIDAGSHDIVVENSRFDQHQDTGLRIERTAGSFGSAEVLIQHNTVHAPSSASATGIHVLHTATGIQAAEIELYNTVMDGHQFDLRLSHQTVLIRNSFWSTQLFQQGGGATAGSGNNLSGNPLLEANGRPDEPASPLINAGIVLAGKTPSTDYDGGPRVFGIRPDIGAFESSVPGTTVFSVSNAADSGAGSLRSILTLANGAPGDAIIEFNIPGACPHEIPLQTLLPTIAKTVRIEGYTQPGSSENSDPSVFDGNVCVFLNGGGDLTAGLNLVTDATTDEPYVSGLGFYGFTAHAILIAGPGKGQVRGSLFGTGLPIIGGGFDDTAIRIVAANGTVIGGPSVSDRNVIGQAEQVGIRIDGAGARMVRNNLIGTNRSGGSLANGVGIRIADGDGDEVRSNTIANSDAQGILLADGANAPQNTTIMLNRIGASPTNGATGGNGTNGIRVTGGDGHEIRSNLINNNGTDGVAVLAPSRRVWMVSNRYVGNAQLPVDLSPDGRNFNDLDVGQTGANDRQNFPSLFDSGGQPLVGSTRVQLSSANGSYVAQIFLGERCTGLDPGTGHDDAAVVVGTSGVLTLSCAGPTFNCTDSIVVPISTTPNFPFTGKFLSAVVWDEEHNTSEFSVCFPYQLAAEIFSDGFE